MASTLVNGASNLGVTALETTLTSVKKDTFANDADRKRALRAAKQLVRELETPIETVLRIAWTEPPLFAALRIAIDVNLFEPLAAEDGRPKSCAQLAEKTGVDSLLLGRLLRHMAAMGCIEDGGPDAFGPTEFSRSMLDPTIRDGIHYMFDTDLPTLTHLPTFLKKTQYRNPDDTSFSPWKFGINTDQDHFPWLNARPELLGAFANHMSGYAKGRPLWTDIYPVKERLIQGFKESQGAVMLVDVGGSVGHDLTTFRERFPDLPGRFILQDQPEVVGQVSKTQEMFEPTAHDFFVPQPVKGARAYFLHSVLHDWPDADALRILASLKPALTPGYSKLIINENVIPNTGADPLATGLDLGMLCLNTSSERTEQDWTQLLSKEGFRVTGVWTPEGGESQGVIEAEVVEG